MGRVQNTFYFFGTFLQIVLALSVGAVAHKVSLVAAFAILACVYGSVVRGGQLAGGDGRRRTKSARRMSNPRLPATERHRGTANRFGLRSGWGF